jgi:hypothetical protein
MYLKPPSTLSKIIEYSPDHLRQHRGRCKSQCLQDQQTPTINHDEPLHPSPSMPTLDPQPHPLHQNHIHNQDPICLPQHLNHLKPQQVPHRSLPISPFPETEEHQTQPRNHFGLRHAPPFPFRPLPRDPPNRTRRHECGQPLHSRRRGNNDRKSPDAGAADGAVVPRRASGGGKWGRGVELVWGNDGDLGMIMMDGQMENRRGLWFGMGKVGGLCI